MNSKAAAIALPQVTDTVTTTIGSGTYSLSHSAAGGIYNIVVSTRSGSLVGARPTEKNIENAVYGHLRAMRALGRTRIDSSEISQALKLSQVVVEQALNNLTKKGVKIVE